MVHSTAVKSTRFTHQGPSGLPPSTQHRRARYAGHHLVGVMQPPGRAAEYRAVAERTVPAASHGAKAAAPKAHGTRRRILVRVGLLLVAGVLAASARPALAAGVLVVAAAIVTLVMVLLANVPVRTRLQPSRWSLR